MNQPSAPRVIKSSAEQARTVAAAVGVIGLLLYLMLPAAQGVRPRGAPQNRKNLKQVGIALHNYLSDHGTFPVHPGGSDAALYLLKPYLAATAFDLEPTSKPTPEARWDDVARRLVDGDLVYANRVLSPSEPMSHTVIAAQKATRPDGRLILLADGSARWSDGPPGPVEELFGKPFTD